MRQCRQKRRENSRFLGKECRNPRQTSGKSGRKRQAGNGSRGRAQFATAFSESSRLAGQRRPGSEAAQPLPAASAVQYRDSVLAGGPEALLTGGRHLPYILPSAACPTGLSPFPSRRARGWTPPRRPRRHPARRAPPGRRQGRRLGRRARRRTSRSARRRSRRRTTRDRWSTSTS